MDENYRRALDAMLADAAANRERDEAAWRKAEEWQNRNPKRYAAALGLDSGDIAAVARHLTEGGK
jgi:hypothetical protein